MVYGNPCSMTIWQRITVSGVKRLLLPATCVVCGKVDDTAASQFDLCGACRSLLPLNQQACRHCALPLTGTDVSLVCGQCLQQPPRYSSAYCAFEYAYPLQQLVRRCKYGHELSLTRVFGRLLADYLQSRHGESWPQCFVPMPLHERRFRRRGYNQVIELGRWLEDELHIAMRTDLLERCRNTAEQAGLSRAARRKNMRGAFMTTQATLPRHVALLDDVITTGSTINEATKVLLRAGVEQVEVWGLARAARGRH